jgi:zinc transporter ZupT
VLLAFAAGAMVFVSFHELVPVGRAVGRTWEVATGAGTGALMVTVFDLVLR